MSNLSVILQLMIILPAIKIISNVNMVYNNAPEKELMLN